MLRPPTKMLVLACVLFGLTLLTCLAAGRQFAVSYANNQAASFDEFARSMALLYKDPRALLAGLPFALTLMTILLAHELGHFFACRHHHIHSSYPFFLPAPTLIGTMGAFILIRSPIRSRRALFDVGASGPLVGFVLAVPALIYGVVHAKVVPGLTNQAEIAFGAPLLVRWLAHFFYPGVAPRLLLMDPVGRAAWVGLFATSLNLLPAAQLDGGHILRSLSPRAHRVLTRALPIGLIALGYFTSGVWYFWAVLLLGLGFLRVAPVYDDTPLDTGRKIGALVTLAVFLVCFMPVPILNF
ncbi:MAG TPA: site-2 protease family protein [Candidatus Acidoferrum sp.]|nr:site-2 protease family protein [Candidatus Acidoferrum sp.]